MKITHIILKLKLERNNRAILKGFSFDGVIFTLLSLRLCSRLMRTTLLPNIVVELPVVLLFLEDYVLEHAPRQRVAPLHRLLDYPPVEDDGVVLRARRGISPHYGKARKSTR